MLVRNLGCDTKIYMEEKKKSKLINRKMCAKR